MLLKCCIQYARKFGKLSSGPEKAMAPHSSTLAWKIPWTEEPGGLQSMGSLRVGHDWVTSLSLFTFMYWRRKWQSTPVFLPGESQGRGSLVGCRPRGHTESDTTEAMQQQQQQHGVVRGSASMMALHWPVPPSDGPPLHSSSSRLCKPLSYCCTVLSLAVPGPNVLLMLWVVSTVLWPILNMN